MRRELDLNGVWRFQPDPNREGVERRFYDASYNVRFWRESAVPGCFEHACPELDAYEGVCWYRRTFIVPSDWRDCRVVLDFGAVNYRARVWLNGTKLGTNEDPFLPFRFDITAHIRPDAPQTLAVAVDNSHHQGDVPGMHVGWRGFGGILRDVRLEAVPLERIESVVVEADLNAARGNIRVSLSLRNDRSEARSLDVSGELLDGAGRHAASLVPSAVNAAPDSTTDIVTHGHVEGPASWSPDSPSLYTVRLTLRSDGTKVDRREVRVGFRTIEATPDGLLLNGTPVFLTGFNRHEDSPRSDAVRDIDLARQDLKRMKESGANTVRFCHYPHDPAELALCDELGLLVFCEVPLYFWNDDDDGRRYNAERTDAAARQLRRMVERDRHHPSIIIWCVSNETNEYEGEVAESNRKLIRRARSLDPSRLCVHVSNRWREHPNFAEDDLICVNGYPSMRIAHEGRPLDPEEAAAEWRRSLAILRSGHPDKPILVTEFGYCSIPGTRDHIYGEDTHATVIEAEFAALEEASVCGALIWCWADHPWPPRRFEDGYAVSPYGVVTRHRRPLAPLSTARRLFRRRQSTTEPAAADGGTESDRRPIVMMRPHMDDIPQTPLPPGYTMRGMSVEDIGLWTDIQRDAEEYFEVASSLFMSQFGDDLPSIGHRCFILRDPAGTGIGTISAWYNRDFHGEDWGRIHWVALRPSQQGKGLGKAMLTYAMNVLARYHERAYLDTDARRTVAVSLYRKYGFEVVE